MKYLSIVLLALIVTSLPLLAGPIFTGDAPADFTAATVIHIMDPGGNDVGVPLAAPVGTVSGWDLEGVYLQYDPLEDALYVGFDVFAGHIFGDADDDGDDGVTSAWLSGLGGTDLDDLGGTEAVTLVLDTNNNGSANVVIGVSLSTDLTGITAATFIGSLFAPASGFGSALPNPIVIFTAPDASAPDLEFRIDDFSTLPGLSDGGECATGYFIGVNAYAGSYSDAGIGEDYVPGAGTYSYQQIMECPVGNEAMSFGAVKTLYR